MINAAFSNIDIGLLLFFNALGIGALLMYLSTRGLFAGK